MSLSAPIAPRLSLLANEDNGVHLAYCWVEFRNRHSLSLPAEGGLHSLVHLWSG